MKRFLGAVAVLFGLWLIACLVIGAVARDRMRDGLIERLGQPLRAATTIEGLDLALVRGRMDMAKLALRRDDPGPTGGHLAIDVAEVRCDLAPLGWALVDGDCRTLAIRGMRVEVSAATMFQLEAPKRGPVHARRVVIDDARLELAPSALIPDLGKIAIVVEHAEANDTLFKTPMSWIFALSSLRAKLELPGDVTVTLRYEDGKLAIGGGLFGKELELPVRIPVADLADDPKAELKKLGELGKQIGAQALDRVEQSAKDWLKSKL